MNHLKLYLQYNMGKTLSDIANGSTVIIETIVASDLRVKLMEMGLIEGRELNVLFRAPLGDPIAVEVSGYVLSLRKDEAQYIHVHPKQHCA